MCQQRTRWRDEAKHLWDTACVLGFFSGFTACQASLQKAIGQMVKLKIQG